MLKPEVKEISILAVFTLLLNEILTLTTIGFVFLGASLVLLNIKTSKVIRNAFALGLFASYWMTYGKVIDPETGLNFLTSIVVLKLLEKDSRRDQYMIFFGLILLISSGSLFERSLTYVFFFGVSFFILIKDFYYFQALPWKFKDLRNALLWVIPLTFIMFFITPRLLNPLPYQSSRPDKGEIGYTPNVNISEVESLESNDRPVFQVMLNKPIGHADLYWRGNTIAFTDGWNWMAMPYEHVSIEPEPYKIDRLSDLVIKQNIRAYNKEDFFFALDRPVDITAGNATFHLNGLGTLVQKKWQWFNRYEAVSLANSDFENSEDLKRYTQVSLPKKSQAWIDENISGTNLNSIKGEIQNLLIGQGFQYSLSPGKITTFLDFMESKKIGYCSHYASALAIILRHKKIPTRLVSGFMGGNFNRYANAYLITQNDAHVWVEALENNKWVRLDPTEWIAPDRVQLGGEAFLEKISAKGGNQLFPFLTAQLSWLKDLKQWFGQWDFKFYQWMEEMDYYTQDAILSRLKLERKWFLILSPLLVATFLGGYAWHMSRKTKFLISPTEELWVLFKTKLKKRGLDLGLVSVNEMRAKLSELGPTEAEVFIPLFEELVSISFKDEVSDVAALKKKLRSI